MAQYDPTNPFAVPPPAATAKREDAISGQMQSLSIGGIAGRGANNTDPFASSADPFAPTDPFAGPSNFDPFNVKKSAPTAASSVPAPPQNDDPFGIFTQAHPATSTAHPPAGSVSSAGSTSFSLFDLELPPSNTSTSSQGRAPPPVPPRAANTASVSNVSLTSHRSVTGNKESTKPTSNDPKVNEALRKFSLDAVLGGLSTQKQVITVGSTIKEEERDSGVHDVSFQGYRGYLGYKRVMYSSTDKREYRVKKSINSAIKLTLQREGMSVCKCSGEVCDSRHQEVAFIPYQAIARMRHVQTSSKKGFNFLALETEESSNATFVIYSQRTKQIKAAINVRYNALLGKAAQEEQDTQQDGDNDSISETSNDRPTSIVSDSTASDPFAKYIREAPSGAASGQYAQGEWWR